jgi:uncharacterized protein (DUF952 family)/transcriptional regulator with XRE-family HTH domain
MTDFAGEVRRFMTQRGISLRGLAREARYDPSYLSKVLRGRKPTSPHLAARLDDALDAGGKIKEAASSALRPTLPHREHGNGTGLPHHRVGTADMRAIVETLKLFRDLDNRFGGAHAYKLAAGYLDSNVVLMIRTGSYTVDIGQQLFGAAAQLAHLAAWSAYDMDDSRHAEFYFSRALELASAAGDHAFAGEVLAARSHRAIHLGMPYRAIELARASRHATTGTATPALLAEAHELEANGHALLGDARACAASLHECETTFARSDPGQIPSWLQYFDHAYLAARFAHTLRDLGDWHEAERFAIEASAISEDLARTRAFNTALLAGIYVETDRDRALAIGTQALTMATSLQSYRAVHYITDLRRRLRRRYGTDPKVRDFEEQARQRLGSHWMVFVYHIATAQDWKQAQSTGEYTTSTRGRTLAEQGFIHGSTAMQVALVANAVYKGVPELLVLVIDPDRVRPEIRYEQVPGWDSTFPHIYGPLNIDAVVDTRPLESGPDNEFSFTEADS